jgi:hypothetical protein
LLESRDAFFPTEQEISTMPRASERNQSPEDRRFIHQHARDLSRTTVAYAKWIHGGDDEPDHRGQTLATRSPDVIRTWAEARGGIPSTVESDGGEPRVLRLDFPRDGGGDSRLKHIEWKDWLEVFQDRELVFLYQETLANGRQSNFFRLDSPERGDG